ncbi:MULTISPECIES: phosphatidylinositol 4-kinase [unclassified Corallococcus]|uniref:phosphatidylinositol 4-kinase n=1 Tax=unclassified Corallococcus TaxID=2685029 RepID=UPI001CBE35C6|nr:MULTISPECIES: phosphatidylinositol 4-kinase [unclassified Corallococcus]MBZ4335487.1 hypothetical protein [Corallococcus sp. AS-1-12]MBZ4372895.1 hypothetical protein [Corallococcus sp. AS-1-6]
MTPSGTGGGGHLFGNAIERVSAVVDARAVEVDHSSEAVFAVDGSGRKWVRKKMLYTGWQPILAESLGWLIGRDIGVRAPVGAICGSGDELSWLSSYVPNALHWQRNYAHFVQNIDEFGAMLALDALLYNADRHAKNILLVPEQGEENLIAWSIDVGNALVGHPQDFIALDLGVPKKPNSARALPLELMRVGAFAAAKQAAKLARTSTLERYVTEACEIVSEGTAPLLLEALSRRMESAVDLVEEYLKVLEGFP